MNRPARIPELDGIRGLAITLVLVLHYFVSGIVETPPGTLLSYAKAASRLAGSGVDLFFVLSGFLIGGILLDSRDRPDYFRSFYTRRFFRIVPIYVVALGIYWCWVTFVRTDEKQLPWLPYFFYLQNFWMAARNNLGQFAATWSLAIEEQFYLTLPAIVWFVNPRHFPRVLGAGIVGAFLLRCAIAHFFPAHWEAAVVLMPCRADVLLLGVAGAWVLRTKGRDPFVRNSRALWIAFIVLFGGTMWLAYHYRHGAMTGTLLLTVGATWLALFFLSLILVAVTQPQSWLAAALRFAPLRWLGMIAYGVYLTHQLVLSFLIHGATQLSPFSPVSATLLALTLTLAICVLSWICFEKPLIDLGHRLTARR